MGLLHSTLLPLFLAILCQNSLYSQATAGSSTDRDAKRAIAMDTSYASLYFSLGEEFQHSSRFDSAVVYFQRAGKIYEDAGFASASKPVWSRYVRCYNEIGLARLNGFDYDGALAALNKAMTIGRQILGENHPDVAMTYSNIGVVYSRKGEFARAAVNHQKALAIRQQTLGFGHPETAKSHNNLGIDYMRQGDYVNALQELNKALSIKLTRYNESSYDVAKTYHNIALMHYYQHEYREALAYFRKAEPSIIQTLGESNLITAQAFNNAANLYRDIGEFERAREYYTRALKIYEKIVPEDHPQLALNHTNLGITSAELGDYDAALNHYETALRLKRDLRGEKHLETALAYYHLGTIYQKKQNTATAIDYYEKSLQIRAEILGPHHPEVAQTYYQIAGAYHHSGNLTHALQAVQQSIIALVAAFSDDNIYANPRLQDIHSEADPLKVLTFKALLFSELYSSGSAGGGGAGFSDLVDMEMSLGCYQLVSGLIEKMQSSFRTAETKRFLKTEANHTYRKIIDSALELFRLTDDNTYSSLAFEFSEKRRANLLLQVVEESNIAHFNGVPDTLMSYASGLRTELQRYDQRVMDEVLLGQEADSSLLVQMQNRLNDLNDAYAHLMDSLKTYYPDYYRLRFTAETVNAAAVQQELLDEQTVILSYYLSDSLVFTFIVGKHEVRILQTIKDAAIDERVAQFRDAIVNNDYAVFTRLADDFYRTLISPVSDRIKDKKLIIIPDGALAYLPFEALITETPRSGNTRYDKLKYLVEKHPVSYAYSVSLLAESRHRGVPLPDTRFLGFAPGYTTLSGTNVLSPMAKQKLIGHLDTGGRKISSDGNILLPLQESEEEVGQAVEIFRKFKKPADFASFGQATENRFLAAPLADYSHLQLSAYTLFNEENPYLSGVVFAQDGSSTEDNILLSGELYSTRMNADLLILSAAGPATEVYGNGHAIGGLLRGWIHTGVRNFIVSLWRPESDARTRLLNQFYNTLLTGTAKTEALQAAKLEIIKERRTAAPRNWAMLVLHGM